MAKLNFSIALGLAAQNFKQGLSQAQAQLKGFASSVKSAFGMVAGAFAAGQIKQFSQECLNAYKDQQIAETKLQTIMRQRMQATDDEVKSILKLTSAQQQLGVIGDEVQIAGAQQVATFVNEKQSLETLIPAMNNLLAQQKGLNASQGDAVSIGNLMGKVMQGQTSALKRVGITFTEAEEKVLKYGNEQERAAMLAKVITNNVGDMNSELAKTDLGKIQQMNNTLGDLKEKIGGAIAPIVARLAPSIANFATSASDKIVPIINFIGDHFSSLVQHIIALFASIKITKFISAMRSDMEAATASMVAKAQAAATRRQAIEQKVTATIKKLRTQETLAAKLEGDKQIIAETKVAELRQQLKQQLVQRNKACEEQIAVDAEVAAMKAKSGWSRAMGACSAAVKGFVASAKATLKSFAISALIMVVIEAVMKLYSTMQKTNTSFQNLANTVGVQVKKAFDWMVEKISIAANWLDTLDTETGAVSGTFQVMGATIMAVFNTTVLAIKTVISAIDMLIKVVGDLGDAWSALTNLSWDGIKGAVANAGNHIGEFWNKLKGDAGATAGTIASEFKTAFDAFGTSANKVAWRKANKGMLSNGGNKPTPDPTSPGGGGSGKGGSTKETVADDVKKAEEQYAQALTAIAESEKNGHLTQLEAQKQKLQALNTKYDAYAEAFGITQQKEYSDAMAAMVPEIKKMTSIIEDAEKEATQRDAYNKAVGKLNKVGGSRDTTYDYKLTDSERAKADLEHEIDVVRQKLAILQDEALQGIDSVQKQITELMAQDMDLETKLNLQAINEDVAKLKEELKNSITDGVIEGWQSLTGTISSVNDMLDKFADPDTSGWEKFVSVIDTAIGVFQTVMGVIELINSIKKASTALTLAEAAAEKVKAAATLKAAAAAIFAAHAYIPMAGVGIASGQVGTMMGVMAGLNAVSLSTGGIVKGSSLAGDFVPALLNSQEAVLNPTQQSRFMKIANGGGVGNSNIADMLREVRFIISGDNLEGTFNNHMSRKGLIR